MTPTRFCILLLAALAAGCAGVQRPPASDLGPIVYATQSPIGGFDARQARDLLEMCVDLDSQDDLAKVPAGERAHSPYAPDFKDKDWETVLDSRMLVAEDRHRADPGVSVQDAFWDAKHNGFSEFDNAWHLWRSTARPSVYALAVRGTVATSWDSFKEDFLATTIPAKDGIELPRGTYIRATFAEMPYAEVHAGFAYGAFATLFDSNYGFFAALERSGTVIPRGSELLITGHSQGAAMATLIHAFLYYAQRDGSFGMAGRDWRLKSYVFAQPKPGNAEFALDFAGIAGTSGLAYTINNSLDPVPKAPLTIENAGDVVRTMDDVDWYVKLADNLEAPLNALRRVVSSGVAHRISRLQRLGPGAIYRWAQMPKFTPPRGELPDAVSLDYAQAGILFPLRGHPTRRDQFWQHHATTYRALLNEQYPYSTGAH